MRWFDVIVVGAGPTGLTAAHLCRRLGLSAVVIEQRDGPQRAPAAHVVNARTFEIWRQVGLPMNEILAAALPPSQAGFVHFVTRLGGEVVGSLPFERQGPDQLEITPTPLRNLSQHRLEPLLLDPALDVRYSHTFLDAVPIDDGVRVEAAGPAGPVQIEGSWLLGADGAASSVRRGLGIAMDGPRTIQSFVMVHLAADFRSLVGPDPGVLYFLVDPEQGGTFVSHGIDREWVYMHGWDPDVEPLGGFDDDRCRALVRSALEDPATEFEVLGASTWHMSAQIAQRYRSGRAFLAGDAAHRFPPTGGLGLNSGIGDVHNLVWKLAAVEAGWAQAGLLDTYEDERMPVARYNCDQSLSNAIKLAEVPRAFGFADPALRTRRAMEAALRDADRRRSIDVAIADQAIHFDLQGLHLGYSYAGPLVMNDGSTPIELDDPARDYLPSTRPGGRLPHAWIDPERSSSTLDLVDPAAPTVLVPAGAVRPTFGAGRPVMVRFVPADVWSQSFSLGEADCLVVRPDQHIAFRGPAASAESALDRLLAPVSPA